MLKYQIFVFALILPISTFSQAFDEHEFLTSLKNSADDTNKVNAFNTYGKFLIKKKEYEKALGYSDRSVLLSKKLDFKRGLIEAYDNSTFIYYTEKQYSRGYKDEEEKLKLYMELGNQKGIANTRLALGTLNLKLNNLNSAIALYKEALKYFKEANEKAEIAEVSAGIGSFYLEKKDYQNSERYSLSALKLFEELNDKKSLKELYENLELIYSGWNKPEKVKEIKKKKKQMESKE